MSDIPSVNFKAYDEVSVEDLEDLSDEQLEDFFSRKFTDPLLLLYDRIKTQDSRVVLMLEKNIESMRFMSKRQIDTYSEMKGAKNSTVTPNNNSLSKSEIKLLKLMLEDAGNLYSNRGCNDIPPSWFDCMSPEEWTALDKEYHEWNGDPEDHDPDQVGLADFCLFDFFSEKLGKE